MKLSRLVSICFLLFAFFACKKDDNKDATSSTNNNPTSYLLKKMTFEHTAATNGLIILFEYNTNNQVSQIKNIQWNYGAMNLPPGQKWYDTSTHSFNYSNNLAVSCTRKERTGTWFYDYEYRGNQIIKRTIKYADGNIQGYNFYHYNAEGKLIERVDSTNKVTFRRSIIYDNQLITLITYNLWSTPQKKSKTEYSNFDSKVNFTKAVNGLPANAAWDDFTIGTYSSSSPNNFGFQQHYWDVDIDKDFGAPTSDNYSYEYNEEGLPTKMYYAGWTVVFEYRKYK
jgi:hypothetical protein